MTASDTEARLGSDQWLDRLNNRTALEVMLASHAEASAAVAGALAPIEAAASAMVARLAADEAGRIIYAGAGTSIRIAVQDGGELGPTFDWPPERLAYLVAGGDGALMAAAENAEDDAAAAQQAVATLDLTASDILIGLSASGRTPYSCAAVEAARAKGALTVGIANNAGTALLDRADIAIPLVTGAEAVAGSTRLKAGTAQKICLNMISTLVMTRLGFVRDGQMVAMKPGNAKLRERFERIHGGADQP